jgi:hypothetical protein
MLINVFVFTWLLRTGPFTSQVSDCITTVIRIVKQQINLINYGSSVSTVSDYRLDDWGSIPGRGKGFFV